jgi:hypothetical protein
MTFLSRSTLSKAISSSLFFIASCSYAINVEKNTSEIISSVAVDNTSASKETVVAEETKATKVTSENMVHKNTEVESVPYPEECDEDDVIDFRIGNNSRDGFFLGVSAISSSGDDFSFLDADDDGATYDTDVSYRVQLASLFIESPGLSSRRIHGMYSMPAWGLNFYDDDDWSFDLFYQYSTRGSKGLEGIQLRNEDERAGLRISGYLESSQLQFIYSPVSRNGEGSDGIEASLSYGYSGQLRNWTYFVDAGVQYRSKEVTPYHGYRYGELPNNVDEGTSAGLAYNVKAGLEYPLTKDWVFTGFVAYHALSDRSIAYRQAYKEDNVENGYRAGLLLSYVF